MPPATPSSIAYAGEPGAFAEDAVLTAFGDVDRSPVGSFRDVFEAVASGAALAGVVPIENVIHGTVRENYDLLIEYDLVIRGEVAVPVRLCLAALPGQRLEDIERVYSHIQALGQAEIFLRSHPWQLLSTYNTAGAGKAIVDRAERGAAAVLSPRAAGLFGLEILADEIGDLPANRTRFVVLARPDAPPIPLLDRSPTVPRTTLVVAVRNEPGTLLAVLRVIAERGLNMRKLESRPSRERAWEYVFWIDLDGDAADPAMAAALEEVRGVTTMTRVLGRLPERRRLSPAAAAPNRSGLRGPAPNRTARRHRRAVVDPWARSPSAGQIALAHARHLVAASAFASRQNGQALVGSGGTSLMKILLIT